MTYRETITVTTTFATPLTLAVKALDRYGHHDRDCPAYDVFDAERTCACGFNQTFLAALESLR